MGDPVATRPDEPRVAKPRAGHQFLNRACSEDEYRQTISFTDPKSTRSPSSRDPPEITVGDHHPKREALKMYKTPICCRPTQVRSRRRACAVTIGYEESMRTDDDESSWIARYRPLLNLTFDLWSQRGEWPSIAELQRVMDREDHDVDVLQALEAMPRLTGEQRAVQLNAVPLPIRVLRHLPQAHTLLDACVQMVKRALEIYLSDSIELSIDYDDPAFAVVPAELLQRATMIVTSDYPFPFGGGNYGSSVARWRIGINPINARDFRGVSSIDDYVAAQARFLLRTRPQPPVEVSRKFEVFVIMPFGEREFRVS